MERIGVSIAVIIDMEHDDISNVVMSDDGTGGGIRIPGMLIGKTDGSILIDFLNRESDDVKNKTALMATFTMEHPDNRVEYDIWYTSSSDRALDFINEFSKIDNKLGDDVLMTPRIVYWQCLSCDNEYKKSDCYGGGKYCAIEPDSKVKGTDII